MMRIRYPGNLSFATVKLTSENVNIITFAKIGVVDIAYAASAPMKFISQEIGSQFDYYQRITETAEATVKGCSSAVRNSIKALHSLKNIIEVIEALWICHDIPEYLLHGDLNLFLQEIDMMVMYTFANLV